MNASHVLAPDVLYVPVDDGSARLLDMNGSTFALSRTGAEILRETLAQGKERAVQSIADRYRIAHERVALDADRLLGELVRARLLSRSDAGRSRPSLRAELAQLLASTGLRLLRLHHWPPALVALAGISFALFGWANTVLAWERCSQRSGTRAGGDWSDRSDAMDRIDNAIRRAAARMPRAACKERALSTWYLLLRERVPATLVVGIQLYPLEGHCWCEVGDRILSDYRDRCEAYRPVARYGLQAISSEGAA